jgi:hypothetical protein
MHVIVETDKLTGEVVHVIGPYVGRVPASFAVSGLRRDWTEENPGMDPDDHVDFTVHLVIDGN